MDLCSDGMGAVPLHRPWSTVAAVPVPLVRVLKIAAEYEQAGRYDDAAELLRAVLDAVPDQPDALHLLGVLAFRKDDLPTAVRLTEQAIAQGASPALFWRNLCTLYERVGRYEEAVSAGQRATELDPRDPEAQHNLGVAYYRLLRIDEAVACALRAILLDPTLPAAHFALAEALLVQGEFAAGWEEYEWRFQMPDAGTLLPKTDAPQWNGAPIADGRLLLIADQGFGDVIQFSRYIPWARERCPHLVLACGGEVLSLFRHNFPWLHLTNRLDLGVPFSASCPLSGLPRLHGTNLETMLATTPCIRAVPDSVADWKRRLDVLSPGPKRRIGIVWAGRANPPNRSMGLPVLAPVAALDGVVLVALQKGAAQAEVAGYNGRAPLINLGPEIADFSDTAAIIESLDLVVTIDTAVAHLAASMGKPVWIMLPYSSDWRWLRGRSDSPWYPTARLFRQEAPGQWGPVAARVAEALSDTEAAPLRCAGNDSDPGRPERRLV